MGQKMFVKRKKQTIPVVPRVFLFGPIAIYISYKTQRDTLRTLQKILLWRLMFLTFSLYLPSKKTLFLFVEPLCRWLGVDGGPMSCSMSSLNERMISRLTTIKILSKPAKKQKQLKQTINNPNDFSFSFCSFCASSSSWTQPTTFLHRPRHALRGGFSTASCREKPETWSNSEVFSFVRVGRLLWYKWLDSSKL